MKEAIKSVTVSAPGRIDLAAGPTDWCGMNTLALAINLRAYATVTKLASSDEIEIVIGDNHLRYTQPTYDGNLDLFKAVIELTELKGFKVEYHTDIPRGSGLGGSAPLSVATVMAISRLFNKNWSKYYMAELAQRAETLKLNTVQGYQDQYTAMFGDLIFMNYSGKQCQRGDYSKAIETEPYTTVENLSEYMPDFHIVVAIPTITRTSSNQTNGSLSDRYLDHEQLIVDAVNRMARGGLEAKKAVVDNRLTDLYRLINEDNDILRTFEFLTPENEKIISIAKENGAVACKTCGAGRGAVALFAEDENGQKKIYQALKDQVENIYYVKPDTGARYE